MTALIVMVGSLLFDAPNDGGTSSGATSKVGTAEDCGENDDCIARLYRADARTQCRPVVEAYARYDYQWTGWGGDSFFFASEVDRREGTIRYSGNALKLQNGFGVWARYRYECLYDYRNRKLVNAIVNER